MQGGDQAVGERLVIGGQGVAEVTVGDIADRAGKSMSWVGKYRTSLERAQVIRTADWGMVAYAIPYFGA